MVGDKNLAAFDKTPAPHVLSESAKSYKAAVIENSEVNSINIVRVFDGDVLKIGSDDYVCLQMEYVEGGSLLARLHAGEIGQQDAVRIAMQVLQGVQQLHHLRFVDRDLKPGNILISTAGENAGKP